MATFILFIVIFGVVVVSHEFGHFLLAKANGIHVLEFSVGMGPTLFSFQKKETKYALKLLPLGGACMFEGEDGLQTQEGEPGEGSFLKANIWARISTVLAGPVFNMILGFIISLILVNMVIIGIPVVSGLTPGGAAETAGMQTGDKIVAINGEKVYLLQDVLLMTHLNEGKEMKVIYEREGKRYDTVLTPQYSEQEGRYILGFNSSAIQKPKGFDSIRYAWYEMQYALKSTYKSLGMLFQGKVEREDVAGPVGIAVNVVGKTYEQAKQYGPMDVLVNMLNIAMLLSVNLGVLNLLPIPALDGGRLVFMFIELIRGKPVPPEKEGMVHFIGLVFFMILMVFLFFNDLANIFMK